MKYEERLLEEFRGKHFAQDYQEEGYKVLDRFDCDFSVSCNDREVIILFPETDGDELLEASVHLSDWTVSDIEIERLNPHCTEKVTKQMVNVVREFLKAVTNDE